LRGAPRSSYPQQLTAAARPGPPGTTTYLVGGQVPRDLLELQPHEAAAKHPHPHRLHREQEPKRVCCKVESLGTRGHTPHSQASKDAGTQAHKGCSTRSCTLAGHVATTGRQHCSRHAAARRGTHPAARPAPSRCPQQTARTPPAKAAPLRWQTSRTPSSSGGSSCPRSSKSCGTPSDKGSHMQGRQRSRDMKATPVLHQPPHTHIHTHATAPFPHPRCTRRNNNAPGAVVVEPLAAAVAVLAVLAAQRALNGARGAKVADQQSLAELAARVQPGRLPEHVPTSCAVPSGLLAKAAGMAGRGWGWGEGVGVGGGDWGGGGEEGRLEGARPRYAS
jgi:hypothetical protein